MICSLTRNIADVGGKIDMKLRKVGRVKILNLVIAVIDERSAGPIHTPAEKSGVFDLSDVGAGGL